MEELKEYLPCWNKLTAKEQAELSRVVTRRSFAQGDVMHRGAEDCVGLMVVVSGRLRVYTISDEGKELTLYRLIERDICLFSASCIMNSIQFDVMVSAEVETEVLHIPADVYKKLMQESAAVANYTNELMAARFSDVMWLMDQVMNKKLDSRLAAFLLDEQSLSGSDVLSITHEQIANHLGNVREVITRMLRHFQDDGLVRLKRGSIELTDLPGLSALAQNSLR